MSSLSEYIQRAARDFIEEMPARVPWKFEVEQAIGSAILTERNRCAQLAQKEGDMAKENGNPQAALGAYWVRKAILAEIGDE